MVVSYDNAADPVGGGGWPEGATFTDLCSSCRKSVKRLMAQLAGDQDWMKRNTKKRAPKAVAPTNPDGVLEGQTQLDGTVAPGDEEWPSPFAQ